MRQAVGVRMRWGMRLVAIFGAMIAMVGALSPAADARPVPCMDRILVLSAFPAELDAVLSRAQFKKKNEVVVKGRSFFPGTLGGHPVVMAMTGIGPSNARITTELALNRFSCTSGEGITAVVFSGVAGSTHRIGDVVVPARWTSDNGATWAATDPFGGRTFPCLPGGGDVFGCRPCEAGFKTPDIARFLRGIVPFVDPDFFLSYITSPPPNAASTEAIDNESAPVAEVAAAHGLPFIAFRGVSDGEGDPLNLPGFPVQFFAYRIISAENAAAAATAFLERW